MAVGQDTQSPARALSFSYEQNRAWGGMGPPTHPLAPGFCGHWLTPHGVTQMGPQLGGRKSRYPCAGRWSFLEALGKDPLPDSFTLLAEVSSMWLQDCSPHSLLTDRVGSSAPRGCSHSLSCFPRGPCQQQWVRYLSLSESPAAPLAASLSPGEGALWLMLT